MKVLCTSVSYRAHGDRDVEVLGAVVLLEGVDVKPNLRNTQNRFLQDQVHLNQSSCY